MILLNRCRGILRNFDNATPLDNTTFIRHMCALLLVFCLGCNPFRINVTVFPEARSVLVLSVSSRDPSDVKKKGAAACARTRDGRYVVITARHLVITPDSLTYPGFKAIDPSVGYTLGPFYNLAPYVAGIVDLPELDLIIYKLNRPIEGVRFADVASQIPMHAKVTAFGSQSFPGYGIELRMLQGTLEATSIDHKALALLLRSRPGDSGGGVFLNGQLIGIMNSGAPIGAPHIRIPFSCVFAGPKTIINFCPDGTPVNDDTTAVAVTESLIETSIGHGPTY